MLVVSLVTKSFIKLASLSLLINYNLFVFKEIYQIFNYTFYFPLSFPAMAILFLTNLIQVTINSIY
jgi:hypothetical protein